MMSIIVQNQETDELILYTKGADSSIIPLLRNENNREVQETKNAITEYAKSGLRTLLLAKRTLTFDEYSFWKKQYDVSFNG